MFVGFDQRLLNCRSVKKTCRWHVFSFDRSGCAARTPQEASVYPKKQKPPKTRELLNKAFCNRLALAELRRAAGGLEAVLP